MITGASEKMCPKGVTLRSAPDIAQSYLQTYLDGYCNTIEFTIRNFSDNENTQGCLSRGFFFLLILLHAHF